MEIRDEFVADTTRYSGPLREAAKDADKFGDKNSQAALAARKMGLAAKEAGEKAARSMSSAGKAAEDFAMGMASAEEKARAEGRALRDMERAAIKAAEAQRAAGKAADQAGDNFRQAARKAELLAAAEQLGALKAAGATKEHNQMLRQLQARFGDLSKEGEGAFKEIETTATKAFAAIGSSGPGSIALAVAALGSIPFVATLAESAITLGVGGALAGLGLYATKGNAQVQAAMHNMTAHVKAEAKQISAPFVQTWLEIAKTGTDTFDAFVPHLTADFAKLAPAVSRFTHDAGYALTQLAPAFDAAANGAAALMDQLGPRLPQITADLGHAVEVMGNASASAAPQFANLVSVMAKGGGEAATVLAHLMDVAVKVGPAVNLTFAAMSAGAGTVNSLLGVLGALGIAGGNTASMFVKIPPPALTAASAMQQFKTAEDLAALSTGKLSAALQTLTGANLSVDQAALAAAQAQKAAADATDHRRKVSLGEHSALLSVVQADQDLLGKLNETGASSSAVAAKMGTLRASFIATAQKMGYTADQARALATRYGLLPRSKYTDVHNNASAAAAEVRSYQAWINRLRGKTVYIHTVYTSSGSTTFGAGNKKLGNADGGLYKAPHFDGGGEVSGLLTGPGTGTSDSIPAPWLSNGEFITREKITSQHIAALENLNAGMSWMRAGLLAGERFANGGQVDGYAKGGKAKKPTKAALAKAAATRSRAMSRPEEIAALAAQQSLANMRASMMGGMFRGGRPGIGSNGSTVVQHVTNVTVNVGGSIRSDQDLAKVIQRQLITNRMPVSLPAGR